MGVWMTWKAYKKSTSSNNHSAGGRSDPDASQESDRSKLPIIQPQASKANNHTPDQNSQRSDSNNVPPAPNLVLPPHATIPQSSNITGTE
jgi:hypothetical protein